MVDIFKSIKCWSKSSPSEISNKTPMKITGSRNKQLLLKIVLYRVLLVNEGRLH